MVLSYVMCKNVQMFTVKMITLSQDLYWNSKQNIPPTNEIMTCGNKMPPGCNR